MLAEQLPIGVEHFLGKAGFTHDELCSPMVEEWLVSLEGVSEPVVSQNLEVQIGVLCHQGR